jgi:hypothetical protein
VTTFVTELEAQQTNLLAPLVATSAPDGGASSERLLEVALANELQVSELAALWMPTTREIDVKLAFARQAGDEAGHFQLVAARLAGLGVDVEAYQAPTGNPMFEYLRGLTSTVERIAAGLFTLEAIAYAVNEQFIALCAHRGDAETVRIYREYIQPDERAHQQLGRQLLAKYAISPAQQEAARHTVGRLAEIAGAARAQASARLGTSSFPGC